MVPRADARLLEASWRLKASHHPKAQVQITTEALALQLAAPYGPVPGPTVVPASSPAPWACSGNPPQTKRHRPDRQPRHPALEQLAVRTARPPGQPGQAGIAGCRVPWRTRPLERLAPWNQPNWPGSAAARALDVLNAGPRAAPAPQPHCSETTPASKRRRPGCCAWASLRPCRRGCFLLSRQRPARPWARGDRPWTSAPSNPGHRRQQARRVHARAAARQARATPRVPGKIDYQGTLACGPWPPRASWTLPACRWAGRLPGPASCRH